MITKQPDTKWVKSADGTRKHYALHTLTASVALASDMTERLIPAGTLLWPSTSSGVDGRLPGSPRVVRPRVVGEDSDIVYLA
jgi:hypothetical protein